MSNHTLKQLQTRKAKLEAELSRLEVERKEASKACDDVRGKLQSVIRQISEASRNPCVSEHAIIRYMERVLGFDIESIKTAILNPQVLAMIESLGDGEFPINGCGGKAVVKNKVVISIV